MHQLYAYVYIYFVAVRRSILEGSKFPVQGSQLRQNNKPKAVLAKLARQ
jgi:hypothetical protein